MPDREWQPGDACKFRLPDNLEDVLVYGVVEIIVGDTASVVELHASHVLWGGSAEKVGETHDVPLANLQIHKLRVFEERRWAQLKGVMWKERE